MHIRLLTQQSIGLQNSPSQPKALYLLVLILLTLSQFAY